MGMKPLYITSKNMETLFILFLTTSFTVWMVVQEVNLINCEREYLKWYSENFWVSYGIDYGFGVDPTLAVKVTYNHGEYLIEEITELEYDEQSTNNNPRKQSNSEAQATKKEQSN